MHIPCISHAAGTSQVMLAAVKCKQNVDPALADALDGAVADMSKMQLAGSCVMEVLPANM